MATIYGLPACTCLEKWCPAFVDRLAREGIKVRFTQLVGSYGPSAGTHAGGAFDLVVTDAGPRSLDAAYLIVVSIARQMGADGTWERPYDWDRNGGIRHVHGLLTGCPHLSTAARNQQYAVRNGRNGLANNGSDTGPRPLTGRNWKQGIKWAKPARERIGTWNVALITKRPRLGDRLRRIRRKVKKVRLDVLAMQERPQNPGKRLDGTLGHLTIRVGKYARYIYFRTGTQVYGAATWDPWKKSKITKWVTSACAQIPNGHKRFYVNCHPISGANYKRHRERWAKAVIVKSIRRAKKHGLGPEGVIFMGDFNGPEFARVARDYGFVRAWNWARIKGAFTRTFNGWGKRKRNDPGGRFDYILIHKSKRSFVHRARTFWTWLASDHSLTIIEIRE